MLLSRSFSAVFGAFILSSPVFAATTVINFDNLTDGTVVTNQYAGVTFSSTPGFVNYVTTQPSYNGTPPNFLCSGPANSSITCTADTTLTFSTPVSNLTFQGLGINNTQTNVAQVDVFSGSTLDGTVIVPGNAQDYNPELIDLTAYSGITSIHIYNITDAAGIGWDTFSYNQSSNVTPEPSSIALLGAGLLGLAWLGKRARPRGLAIGSKQ